MFDLDMNVLFIEVLFVIVCFSSSGSLQAPACSTHCHPIRTHQNRPGTAAVRPRLELTPGQSPPWIPLALAMATWSSPASSPHWTSQWSTWSPWSCPQMRSGTRGPPCLRDASPGSTTRERAPSLGHVVGGRRPTSRALPGTEPPPHPVTRATGAGVSRTGTSPPRPARV